MTLEEAITHYQEVADLCEHIAEMFPEDGPADVEKCAEKAEEHRQLVEWLEELQALREEKHGTEAMAQPRL